MNRVHAFSHLICVLSVATLFQFQSAEAQIFEGTTINSGTIYDSQGFGTYDLSGGSLTLDGSSVFGDGTTIQWDAPISGGTLQFEPTLLTTTGGDLSLTGNPVEVPAGFTISSGGSLEINNTLINPVTFPPNIAQNANTYISLRQELQDQGINYVQTGQTGITLTGYTDQPDDFSQAVPEPSTWALLLAGISLLIVVARCKTAEV